MKTLRRLQIRELSFPVDGYTHNAQIWTSIDGGKSWYYCGIGKFVHSTQEAMEYFDQFVKSEMEV